MASASLAALDLAPALLRAVEKKARRQGKTAREYVRALIECDILADKSFDEILAPVREDVRATGVTEEQLDMLVKRARRSTAAKPKSRSR